MYHTCMTVTDAALQTKLLNPFSEATATAERLARPRRPHAPGNRKSTPEMLSAVRCALSQLQGEPAPPTPQPESPKERQAEAEPG